MTRTVGMAEMTDEQRRVFRAGQALHRDGASPAGALDLLAAIVEERTWERVADAKDRPFAGRFRDFVADRVSGLGCSPQELVKVIGLRHPHEAKPDTAARMKAMRAEVERLLREEIQEAADRGGDRRSSGFQNSTTVLKPRRETAEHTVARLKHADPSLAAEVVNGSMSAYAAARSKGWRPPRIQVTTPERTAVHLRKHMTPGQLAELARPLTEEN